MQPIARLRRGGESCPRCDQLRRTCRACTQRRRIAWPLVVQQRQSIEQAAGKLYLSATRVGELVQNECDRRELERYRLNSIPVTRARAFLDHELTRDPELTRAEVAHRMGIRQADFDHAFGYAPAKHGAMQTKVGITTASRLVRALGHAPYELEGC